MHALVNSQQRRCIPDSCSFLPCTLHSSQCNKEDALPCTSTDTAKSTLPAASLCKSVGALMAVERQGIFPAALTRIRSTCRTAPAFLRAQLCGCSAAAFPPSLCPLALGLGLGAWKDRESVANSSENPWGNDGIQGGFALPALSFLQSAAMSSVHG